MVDSIVREKICINGTVQGVGFRPFVWRLARELNITGSVRNTARGVEVDASGNAAVLAEFRERLQSSPPPSSRITNLVYSPAPAQQLLNGFQILPSEPGALQTAVANDMLICADCLRELFDPANRRYRYPFINCMHCGPRFSIIDAMPYDRANTSMGEFTMCPQCAREYGDPEHRRFHAQPNACSECGPCTWLEQAGEKIPAPPGRDDLQTAAEFIKQGYIVAVKSVGGFRLVCDATNESAVQKLRQRKSRPDKPFALMAKTISAMEKYAHVQESERSELQSAASPIVLLKKRNESLKGIAPGQSKLGFMLPNSAFDYLLLEDLDFPVVMTSANISGDPLCTDNELARKQLAGIADLFLMHDRDIINRADDSVVMAQPVRQVLRRARGFNSTEIVLPQSLKNGTAVLAMGAELKNTFCLLRDGKAVLSSHIGDLKSARTFADYKTTIEKYLHLYHQKPGLIVIDKHPDYLSTRYGYELADRFGISLWQVQHHHAHIAAVMAEHQLERDSQVLGIVMDGLGMGEGHQLWGGEFLKTSYAGCEKLAGLQSVPLPGGAQAMREPWRNIVAHLYQNGLLSSEGLPGFADRPWKNIQVMLEKSLNCPGASSCGRAIDAVAALLELSADKITFEGQAAMMLEALAEPVFEREEGFYYPITVHETDGVLQWQWRDCWQAIIRDLQAGVDKATIAARFHQTLVYWICRIGRELCERHGLDTVALSGGVFQNQLLVWGCVLGFERAGLRCLVPENIPANDGGISLGQAVVGLVSLLGVVTR